MNKLGSALGLAAMLTLGACVTVNLPADVVGAAGGAYVGHEIEKRQQEPATADLYRFNVRMDNGSYQTLTQTTVADLRVDDRVQIGNGVARRY
jgi:outer membrane lipoprotein SlyB